MGDPIGSELGIAAEIPTNTRSGAGVSALFHLFLDDSFPKASGSRFSRENSFRYAELEGWCLKFEFYIDNNKKLHIIFLMRLLTFIVLGAIVLNAAAWFSPTMTVPIDMHLSIGTLDVCHGATSSFSVNENMASLAEHINNNPPLLFVTYQKIISPFFLLSFLTKPSGHPPEA